jgi:hypothetical protein
MLKKSLTLAITMAFTMNLATTAIAGPHGDGGGDGHRHHRPQVQQLSARLHVMPNCTLTKDEDRGDRADFKFREIDAIGSDADDAGNPESTSLRYDCSKWTHPRLTLNDGHRGGDGGHHVADRDRHGDDSKNFYLVNRDDKIAFNIWSEVGHHEFENSDNPHGDGALSLLSDHKGKIDLKANLAPYHGSLEPGHYSDIVTATLFF